MSKIINLIKNLFNRETEVVEATPYEFEYDRPIEEFNEFHDNLKTWRKN